MYILFYILFPFVQTIPKANVSILYMKYSIIIRFVILQPLFSDFFFYKNAFVFLFDPFQKVYNVVIIKAPLFVIQLTQYTFFLFNSRLFRQT